MRTKALSLAVIATILAGGPARPLFAQDSLADVARQEEERRKTIAKPSKVLTNEDLRSVAPVIPMAATTPVPEADTSKPADADATKPAEADATKDKPAATPEAEKAAEQPKDQAYWSGRAKALQTQLERNQTFAVALQSRVNALTTQYVNQSDPVQQTAVATDRQNTVNELNRITKQIEDDKKAIAELQEEARRAGAPPGWLR